mmetsp:Transcript_1426/g.1823  ORF Transcript_1426/g.1823 Transcript_1426/m.1823 type:complete len:97 (+) Transcript_1426:396-686(+)|eukprot:CAMPEP_0206199574 /NCGR_PEP_ID=MMETSP0166-20121206/10346_1 /ASSEMBLY_ACC=CAM_ASM_000260 /TAXON_ID=95228 /ORGANISM="Vannella robusta, Strain DIVA3 518/3/11/1/6" /LENGTH=96 /DNA_ID=CAMNT_0053617709 /DNA_START=392 /DNA_END=682 /DNA_ORIENTATION=+
MQYNGNDAPKRSPLPAMIAGGGVFAVLGYGMYTFVTGKSAKKANNAMLMRVGAQTALVVLAVGGFSLYEGPMVQGWLHNRKLESPKDTEFKHKEFS